ncbi:hypothetical protein NXX78_09875 [Bacteroides fragilis]|nr:hypothetical protein [Bacteroides fragilis]
MDEKMLSLEQETKIKEKALKLKEERKLRKIYPMVVFGDTTNGEKETYVVYMSEPNFPQFSKFMAASKKTRSWRCAHLPGTVLWMVTRNLWMTSHFSFSDLWDNFPNLSPRGRVFW